VRLLHLHTASDTVYFLLQADTPEAWQCFLETGMESRFEAMQAEISKRLGAETNVFIGDAVSGLGSLTAACASVRHKLQYRFLMGHKRFVYDISSRELMVPIQRNYLRSIRSSLQSGNLDAAVRTSLGFSDYMKNSKIPIPMCHFYLKNTIYAIFQFAIESEKESGVVTQLYEALCRFEEMFLHEEQATSFICDMLAQVCGKPCATNETVSELAKQAMQIIRDEYMRDLSLQEVAERLRVTSSHLSRMFKAAYGTNFKEYLIEYKIKKAQKLLSPGNMNIQEVAAAVGYHNPKQFTRVFKKHVDTTPAQYVASKGEQQFGGVSK
jgi:AraC-like DNA-binding protein